MPSVLDLDLFDRCLRVFDHGGMHRWTIHGVSTRSPFPAAPSHYVRRAFLVVIDRLDRLVVSTAPCDSDDGRSRPGGWLRTMSAITEVSVGTRDR